jgi:hypothetical protein
LCGAYFAGTVRQPKPGAGFAACEHAYPQHCPQCAGVSFFSFWRQIASVCLQGHVGAVGWLEMDEMFDCKT